jgi:hypothetical protein
MMIELCKTPKQENTFKPKPVMSALIGFKAAPIACSIWSLGPSGTNERHL